MRDEMKKKDFIVLDEGPGFVREECCLVAATILLQENLLKFTFKVLWIGSCLFKLDEHLPLFG